MKWQLLVASLMIGLVLPTVSSETMEPVSVDRLCGKLVSSEDIQEQGKTNPAQHDIKPIPHARVRLFSPTASGDCCALMTPMAETLSGHDGIFQFKKITPGDYLIVATLGATEYKLLVRYEPVKNSEKNCSELQYTLEKGKFLLRRSVAVAVDY